jgi:hypothetical protein
LDKGRLAKPVEVFVEIVVSGVIRPSWGEANGSGRTVRGNSKAVCFTEQPLSTVFDFDTERYSPYGIAYHKVHLFEMGARPVIYGSRDELYKLHEDLKYLFVRYEPCFEDDNDKSKTDFTWEREWRLKCSDDGLPICLPIDSGEVAHTTLIVKTDEEALVAVNRLKELASEGKIKKNLQRVISMTTAKRMKDYSEYQRIDTWPFAKIDYANPPIPAKKQKPMES